MPRNAYVWLATGLSLLLTLAILYLPPLAAVMQLVPPSPTEWTMVFGFGILPLLAGQIFLAAKRGTE